MSATELDRLNILETVRKKKLTQVKAAELLNISDRQVRNLGSPKQVVPTGTNCNDR